MSTRTSYHVSDHHASDMLNIAYYADIYIYTSRQVVMSKVMCVGLLHRKEASKASLSISSHPTN